MPDARLQRTRESYGRLHFSDVTVELSGVGTVGHGDTVTVKAPNRLAFHPQAFKMVTRREVCACGAYATWRCDWCQWECAHCGLRWISGFGPMKPRSEDETT
jgi:hypothetical protein